MSLLRTPSTPNVVVCDPRVDEVLVHWLAGATWHVRRFEGRTQHVLDFLRGVPDLGVTFDDIDEMGVVMGGPSFTATRVMTVIANTYGFMRSKRLRALPADFSGYDDAEKKAAWNAAAPQRILIPTYNAPPNITMKP